MGFGNSLKEKLKERNMPVTELSRRTGIPASSLYAAIRRDGNMELDSVANIAAALKIGIADLYQTDDKNFQEHLSFLDAEKNFKRGLVAQNRQNNQKAEQDIYYSILDILKDLDINGLSKARDYIADLAKIPEYNKRLAPTVEDEHIELDEQEDTANEPHPPHQADQ